MIATLWQSLLGNAILSYYKRSMWSLLSAIAINREGKARNVVSGAFSKRQGLVSPSSVRSALAGLLDKDFITKERDYYQVYDLFFSIWLAREEH